MKKKLLSVLLATTMLTSSLPCSVLGETTEENKYDIQSDSFVFYRCTSIDSLDVDGKVTNTTDGVKMKALSISDLIENSNVVEKDNGSLVTGDAVYDYVNQSKINHFHYRGEVATKEEIQPPENSHAGDISGLRPGYNYQNRR